MRTATIFAIWISNLYTLLILQEVGYKCLLVHIVLTVTFFVATIFAAFEVLKLIRDANNDN